MREPVDCPKCGVRVVPKSDGLCPSCLHELAEGTPAASPGRGFGDSGANDVDDAPRPMRAPATTEASSGGGGYWGAGGVGLLVLWFAVKAMSFAAKQERANAPLRAEQQRQQQQNDESVRRWKEDVIRRAQTGELSEVEEKLLGVDPETSKTLREMRERNAEVEQKRRELMERWGGSRRRKEQGSDDAGPPGGFVVPRPDGARVAPPGAQTPDRALEDLLGRDPKVSSGDADVPAESSSAKKGSP